jgi:hypothetical protein
MSIGKIWMLDGLVSTHFKSLLLNIKTSLKNVPVTNALAYFALLGDKK